MTTPNDPVLPKGDTDTYSYEHFLAAHDPNLRKARGVFYTPEPAVKYIVRAVDDILRQAFNLPDGIADNGVQILDPAMGTGTFFFEVIEQIFYRIHEKQGPDAWNSYVSDNLLPRLLGFEVMEIPYRLAHWKLAEFLQKTGYRLEENQRFNIHRANALEPQETHGQFPFLVVLGNPPYNVSTVNQSEYAKQLTEKYKEGLKNEMNIQPLSDDYIKFIALGQHRITVAPSGGILAYITNNGFLDGLIHRRMRQSLLETFDRIFILNLHGNTRKKETAPDGSKDENIFDIQQGTSINIFVRNPPFVPLCEKKIFYADLYGKRPAKLGFLETQHIETSGFTEITPHAPDYYFVPKDFSLKKEYDAGFGVQQLFLKYGTGIKFRKDNLLVKNHFTRSDVETMLHDITQLEAGQVLAKYRTKETKDWQLEEKRQYFLEYRKEDIKPVLYRVFDRRWTYYPMEIISQIIPRGDARKKLMRHLFQENLVLLTLRNQPTVQKFDRIFIAKGIIEHCVIGRGTYAFPLYCYDKNGERCLNLNEAIVNEIARRIGCVPSARDIFDYVYGVLFDPLYWTKYQEFLKVDFPRVFYPKDGAEFERYVQKGLRLRKLHLLEDVPAIHTAFPVSDGDGIKNVRYVNGRVFINETQYFEGVPLVVWNFSIGGACPAQKYLKDRKGRILSSEEVLHYQKIVAVLTETVEMVGRSPTGHERAVNLTYRER